MAALTVTKLHIASREAGGNKAPSSGDVTFSDGKSFGWSRGTFRESGFNFFYYRKRCGEWEMVMLDAPKRAAALKAHLDAM